MYAGISSPTASRTPGAAVAASCALSSSVGPTVRINTCALALGASTLGATPPWMVPTLSVDAPSNGSTARSSDRIRASVSSRASTAEWPSSGYAECAARPVASRSQRSEPFCPMQSRFSVGSPFTRNRPLGSSAAAAWAPSEPFSSPTTNNSPTRRSPRSASCSAAAIIAAARPLASQHPRPCSHSPSSRSGTYGGTQSRWVENTTDGASRQA